MVVSPPNMILGNLDSYQVVSRHSLACLKTEIVPFLPTFSVVGSWLGGLAAHWSYHWLWSPRYAAQLELNVWAMDEQPLFHWVPWWLRKLRPWVPWNQVSRSAEKPEKSQAMPTAMTRRGTVGDGDGYDLWIIFNMIHENKYEARTMGVEWKPTSSKSLTITTGM